MLSMQKDTFFSHPIFLISLPPYPSALILPFCQSFLPVNLSYRLDSSHAFWAAAPKVKMPYRTGEILCVLSVRPSVPPVRLQGPPARLQGPPAKL